MLYTVHINNQHPQSKNVLGTDVSDLRVLVLADANAHSSHRIPKNLGNIPYFLIYIYVYYFLIKKWHFVKLIKGDPFRWVAPTQIMCICAPN